MAMLAMGIQCVVMTAETNQPVSDVARATLKGCLHVGDVNDVKGADLVDAIRRRGFRTVFIGGGAPCQGNTSLSLSRKGLQDDRTQGADALV